VVILVTDNAVKQRDPYHLRIHIDPQRGFTPQTKAAGLYQMIGGPQGTPVAVYEGINNWDAAIAHLSRHPDKDIRTLILSGHGSSDGGVATQNANTHLTYPNLTDKHVAVLKAKVRGEIFLWRCHSGCSDNLAAMAKKLGIPIYANTGLVSVPDVGPIEGAGEWVIFRP
jgi:hypothetical protein